MNRLIHVLSNVELVNSGIRPKANARIAMLVVLPAPEQATLNVFLALLLYIIKH